MTAEQIREVVKITLDELTARGMVKDSTIDAKRVVEGKLTEFFNNKGDGNGISYCLSTLSDDPYIDVIYLNYRDEITIERIAEIMDKDESTIKRNKKRLIIKMYELMEGFYE